MPQSSVTSLLTTPARSADGGPRIEQVRGIVNGEAIIGANIFRDLLSSVRDVVGGRAGGYERALSGARDAALDDLKAAVKNSAPTVSSASTSTTTCSARPTA